MSNNDILELIEYSILSPYFNERGAGINLVLIAKPESGKTYSLKPLRNVSRVMFIQDFNYASLVGLLSKIREENIRTIVIPDMSKIFSKRSKTLSQLITALNLLIEEGITKIYLGDRYPPINFNEPLVCNIVGGTTWSSFRRIYRVIGNVEFISRIVPVSYQLSEYKVKEILDNLDKELMKNIQLPKEDYVPIEISKKHKLYLYDVAKSILPSIYTAMGISKEDLPYGIRLTRSLILMCMAKAWKEGRDGVTIEDRDHIERLAKKWIGFNFEVI